MERAGAPGSTRVFLGGRGNGPGSMAGVAVLVAGVAVLVAAGAALLAGCSSGGQGAVSCGTTRTAANVPVVIEVVRGSVNCATALKVEDQYAAMIRDGQVPGNGGGAPVTVSGWTCQGYNTPEMLQTGDASQCHTSTAKILAVLPVPVPTAT